MLTYPFRDVKVCIYQTREVKRMRTIAGLRADEKLTQEDLANELGVSTQTIKNWERNQTNLRGEVIKKLAIKFNVSADELLGLEKLK